MDLTSREQDILKKISVFLQEHGFPPSVRELGRLVGLSSPDSVHAHLKKLQAKGYLKLSQGRFRALRLARRAAAPGGLIPIPILGRVPAGPPNLAFEDVEGYLHLGPELARGRDLFALRVRGDSMEQAGILEGDLAVVRPQPEAHNGEIVVARVDGEVTLKRFKRTRGQAYLEPANPRYKSIPLKDVEIIGEVVATLRSYKNSLG